MLLFSGSDTYAQGRDRSKFQSGYIDTSFAFTDTSQISDTTKIRGPVDSTARVNNFKYERPDELLTPFGIIKSPLLMYGSTRVQYNVTFDSLNNVVITETIEGVQYKVPRVIPLEKYIEARSKLQAHDQFYRIIADAYQIETEDDLSKLFKNITEITIPLPFASETIFGPPTINLKINGIIDITASYQKSSNDLQTITSQSQDQNNINFKQEVQVSTKGTVGDKLTVDADWNSQRTFEFENQLKLKYKGYPDEVIQSIEAGNVSLETRSNLIGSTQSLFGVKAQFKLGPLTLTTIASQKRSEKKEVNITGGSVETPFNFSITNYSENNYLLDENYEDEFEDYFKTGTSNIDVTQIEVWVISEPNFPQKRLVLARDSLDARPTGGYTFGDSLENVDGKIYNGIFKKLESTEFTLNRYAGFITLNGNIQTSPNDVIAVAYRVTDSTGEKQYGDLVNDVPSNAKLKLKLLRYSNQQPPSQNINHSRLWRRMLKNIYNLGVRNIKNDPNNLEFNIYYNASGVNPNSTYDGEGRANTLSYMYITRVDYRRNGNPSDTLFKGDGAFDFFPGNTIDLENGNVIFPTIQPFGQTFRNYGIDEAHTGWNDSIYTSSKTTINQSGAVKFTLVGKAKGDASSRYSLGFNLVEGSVKVFNGSIELVPGIDYSIDYSLGELVIINASALVTGANLKITYETNDLFQLASKTLLGTRAELQINKTSYLGFTLINLKQQTLNDKIRIGEEPTNNTMIGFDASTDIKTGFLTKLVNKIPGYNTKEESILNFKGEVAFMLPEPNTLKSTIPSDNGESVAYIDDFEGVKKIIPLGLNPLSWALSSMPIDSSLVPANTQPIMDSLMSLKRSKLNWYNLLNNVPIKEVYPYRDVAGNQNQTLTPLVFNIQPSTIGQYNFIKQQQFTTNGLPKNNWSGVFKFLNTSQTNLIDENINYIEIWMQVNGGAPIPGDSAKMIIDLGTISEKIIISSVMKPKSTSGITVDFHTEDKDLSGALDVGEDVGIDGYNDEEEKRVLDSVGVLYDDPNDPCRDNYAWSQGSDNYSSFNGTEENATNLTEAKRIDTEDLNNSATLNTLNNYFEYVIPLDSNSVKNHPFITGGGNAGWYQFVIPLDQYKKLFGTATLTNIQYARVWFKGFESETKIKIVDFNLVGNQWVKQNKQDTTYNIGVVSIEDNPTIYSPPVEGLRQRDQTQVDQNVLSNEQSITLDVNDLLPGQGKFVFKSLATRPFDLINYKILKLFVNGDSSFIYTNENTYDAAVVVRIGSDTANYYEYRAPIHPDIRPATPWNALNEVVINLSELTAVKQKQDSSGAIVYENVPNGPPGSKYGVLGNPTIRTVTQITVGVYNNNTDPIVIKKLSGSVWFDELRVLKTNDDNGYAFTLSTNLKIADLAVLNFSYNKTDPNFHNLESSFGNLNLANSWEFSGQVNAHKVINALLSKYVSLKFKDFFTIPITFSHTEILDKPKYLPSTDIDLETAANNKYLEILAQTGDEELAQYYSDEIRISSQTLRIANKFSISGMKFTFPGENFFVRQILNKMEMNFVRNSYTERTPTLENKYAWDMNGSIGMSSDIDLMNTLNLKIGRFLPLGAEFSEARMYFFFPFIPLAPLFTNSLTLQGTFNRRRGDEKLRTQFDPNPTSRQFDAGRGFNMNWKFLENWIIDVGGDYSFNAGSDLTYLETKGDSLQTQRDEGEIIDDIFFNDGLINWGKDLDYTQVVSINPKFNIPGLRDFMDITASYRVNYGWKASQYSNNLGSTVGYSSDLQATSFLKLNQIINLFKPSEKIMGGSQPSGSQSDQDPADILKILGTFVPDQISLTFSQSKQLINPAVDGRPGFANFWMQFNAKENLGPSRLYQMGWITEPGKRIPLTQLTDNMNVNNAYTLNTFINPIFPNNMKINFTYKAGIGKINTFTYISDDFGLLVTPLITSEARTITRPSFFVSSDVTNKLARPDSASTQAKEIADSFENSVVSFPFPSWNLTLNGVEKFEMFTSFAQAITIESGYSAEYRKVISYDGRTPEFTSAQAITSGFTPLIGVNINFKPISGGTFTASFKLSNTDNFNLEPLNAKLTNTSTSDIAINASYTKSGFNIPLFGLSLENNMTISFSYTRTKNDPVVYSYDRLGGGIWNSNSLNGSTSTILNPTIQYNLSNSVTLQLFYKYTKIEPTGNNLIITTRTSNEAGLNVRLQIQ
jgi:Motility related/secretion protein